MSDEQADKSSTSQFLDSVMAYMERRIAGYQQRGDSIFNGSIMAEELQEWLNRLRSCVPSSIEPPHGWWSFLRSVLSQGASIQQDYIAGTHKGYEEYSARLDAAAMERAEEIAAVLSSMPSATASIRVPRDQLIEWALWLKGRREVAGQVSMDSIETAILDLLNAPNDIGESRG